MRSDVVEVFVGDIRACCIFVLSFSGELLRTLHGDFRVCDGLLWANGRLYFLEGADTSRIVVARPDDGSTLQLVDPPEGQELEGDPWQWGDRLLVEEAPHKAQKLVPSPAFQRT